MATTEQSYGRVAKAVVGDVHRSAKAAADEVLPKGGPGNEATTKQRMIEHFRAGWPYPEIRAAMFKRMVPAVPNPFPKDPQGSDAMIPAKNGLEHWENLVAEAFPLGWPEPLPVPPVMGAGGFEPGVNGVPY